MKKKDYIYGYCSISCSRNHKIYKVSDKIKYKDLFDKKGCIDIINKIGIKKASKDFQLLDSIKYILINNDEFINDLPDAHSLIRLVTDYNWKRPKCIICFKYTGYKGTSGFRKYCSIKCREKDKDVQIKREKTNLKRFGVKNPYQSEEIKQKIKQTCLDKYGVDHWMKTEEGRNHCKNILLNPEVLDKGYATKKNNRYYRFLEEFENIKPLFSVESYSLSGMHYKVYYDWKCNHCNYEFKSRLFYGRDGLEPCCPNCSVNKFERSIGNFLLEQGLNIKYNDRTILEGLELDIIIPKLKIAIECNGNYWHSELYRDRLYHKQKLDKCKEKGWQLISIFEDEYINKLDIVFSRLKHKIGIIKNKIHARKCEIREINPKEKNQFLEKYHIQGKDYSSIKLGAFYNNELISVMTFSKLRMILGTKSKTDQWELSRFAIKHNVVCVGLCNKLLSYFKNNYEWNKIISYCDLRWNIGNSYLEMGFKLEKVSPPNYWYIHQNNFLKRYHRAGYMKNKLANRLEEYDPEKTEHENMLNNGFIRIWDCGNNKYILNR